MIMKEGNQMKKILSAVLVMMLLFLAAAPALADNMDDLFEHMYVNCANGKTLNLRESPRGKVIAQLENGTKVWISGGFIEKGWVAVTAIVGKKTLNGVVKTEFLQNKKPGKYEITEREDNFKDVERPYIVTAKALNSKTDASVGFRKRPNKTSTAFRRLDAGDQLLVIAEAKVWLMVWDPISEETGYVANDYMIFDHFVDEEEDVAEDEPADVELSEDDTAEDEIEAGE